MADVLVSADEAGGLVLLDRDGAVRAASAALARALGYAPTALRGRRFVGLLPAEDRPRWRRHLAVAQDGGALLPLACRLQGAEGEWRSCTVQATLLEDGGGELTTALTVRPLAAGADAWAAAEPLYDAATGLPGRALLLERLALATVRGQRRADCRFALLLAALEGSADELAAERSAERLRSLLGAGDMAARLGGAAFVLLLDDVASAAEVERTAERCAAVLAGSGAGSGPVRVGVVMGEAAGGRPQTLLAAAARAVQAARALGRGVAWDGTVGATELNPLAAAEQELRRGIEHGELRLQYQPLLDLHQATIVGVEALVRWRHPTRGLLTPGAFLPLAEASGLALPLGRWVLREAVRQLAAWQARFVPCHDLRLSVNLAGEQLAEPGFAEEVRALLAAHGVAAGCLWLEVGETALLADREDGVAALRALRERGVQVSLDDCASAAAARAALRSLPLDRLKIDGALIAAVGAGGRGDAAVRDIAALAHSAGKEVIAEGVETAEQLALLRAVACDYEQGYLCAKPLPAGALQHILAGQR